MDFLEKQRRDAIERANREMRMIAWAESTIRKLGLWAVLPYVTNTVLWEDYSIEGKTGHPDWEDYLRVPNNRYILTLFIPMADKEQVRPHLLHLDWKKHTSLSEHYRVGGFVTYLVESWCWQESPDYKAHTVYIDFYRPAQEGEAVGNNGCKVQRVRTESTKLTLSCELEAA